ncbi:MAG: TetR/AcrR family transcriptional regulator [Syntrophomonadaceae bacterium]|nr:TetR/AcrR family transcriptional regulator [Syntrophomonadaceae bacterium]
MSTEDRIVKAFKQMARSQGFNAVKMEELAVKAGITKKTIYSYFTSKQDLIEKVVNAFISDVTYKVEDIINKSDLVENIAATIESLLKEGSFLFNVQSLQDLQIYYPETWQQIEEFRKNLIGSVVDVIFKRTKKKWVLEMEPRILKEAFLAINSRFSTPEFALEMGMPVKELTFQLAKLLIYPYL